MVQTFFSVDQFRDLLQNNAILVVDFYADWCAPCRAAAPEFSSLADQYNKKYYMIEFLKVNVDHFKEFASNQQIKSLPTFKFFVRGSCLKILTGFNLNNIKSSLESLVLEHKHKLVLDSLKSLSNDCESKNAFEQAKSNLLKIFFTIINNPMEERLRHVYVDDPVVMDELINIPGAMNCLFDAGFEEGENRLTYPGNKSLDYLKKMISNLSILQYRESVTRDPLLRENTILFLNKIRDENKLLSRYENAAFIAKALDSIKLVERKERVNLPQDLKDNAQWCELLKEMLRWFKQDFFSWTDKPQCQLCQSSEFVTAAGQKYSSTFEISTGTLYRIELYKCSRHPSQDSIEFRRYNCPGKLLDTRTGRCGEWANCFALCLKAVGFKRVRYVHDFTDHVWIEVLLNCPEVRWIHCDPCELAFDKPLLYERGWGKKLTHVIAHELDTGFVHDVSWRYYDCKSFNQHLIRRSSIADEHLLTKFILQHNQTRLQSMPKETSLDLTRIMCLELVSFLTPTPLHKNHINLDDLSGRTTGSFEWRMQRGEIGSETIKVQNNTLKFTDEETDVGELHIRYNSAKDHYMRVISNKVISTITGWQSFANNWQNIFRKVEHDWNMVYLCRNEDSDSTESGEIEWKIDVLDRPLYSIEKIKVLFMYSEFENSKVETVLEVHFGEDQMEKVSICGFMDIDIRKKLNLTDDVRVFCIVLRSRLSGGEGSTGWQKSQLFRQKVHDQSNFPLDLKIIIEKRSEHG